MIPVANSQESVHGEIIGEHNTIQKPLWIKEMGGYNGMPTPFKKIPDKDLNEIFSFYIIHHDFVMEFRQVQDLYSKEFWNGFTSIKIFWFYNCGIGICQNPKTEKLELYRIGCEHKKTSETQLYRSYYRVTCQDCGFQYEYDCSD